MKKEEQLIITQMDYNKLITCITNDGTRWNDSYVPKEDIYEKLITATIISDTDFPRDAARLYSTITLRDTIGRINHDYNLLPPNEVDDKNDGMSVLSPFGFALLGRRLGSSFTWQFKTKKKSFLVVDIKTPYLETCVK